MCQHETKTCGRCNEPFECKVGNILQCQCNGISLSDDEKKYLADNYTDCLCRNCLLAIKEETKLKPALSSQDFFFLYLCL